MRGKDRHAVRVGQDGGITPACAGKRMVFAGRKSRTWDHPRVCGEKCIVHVLVSEELGITPAYAGKSLRLVVTSVLPRDHPRVCGEKAFAMARWDAAMGSPPRMRGKVIGEINCLMRVRITPACAGKRLRTCGPCGCPEDHPRVCGEKCWLLLAPPTAAGSPPRMRGKAEFFPMLPHDPGITPAYAGKRGDSL